MTLRGIRLSPSLNRELCEDHVSFLVIFIPLVLNRKAVTVGWLDGERERVVDGWTDG